MWIHGAFQRANEKIIDGLKLKILLFSVVCFVFVLTLPFFFKNAVDESKSQAYSSLHQLTTQTKQAVSTAL
jgi:hypothetical protein